MDDWEFPIKLIVNPKMSKYLKDNDLWSEETMMVSEYVPTKEDLPPPLLPRLPKFLEDNYEMENTIQKV